MGPRVAEKVFAICQLKKISTLSGRSAIHHLPGIFARDLHGR